MNGKGLSWPQAVVIVAVITGVIVLAFFKRDIASYVTLGVAILGAIGVGVGQLGQVKQIVNGNLSRILDQAETKDRTIEAMSRLLAAAHVPQSALQPSPVPVAPDPAVPPEPPTAGGAAE